MEVESKEVYELSKLRLNLMRFVYGLTFLSLGSSVWSYIISPDELIQPFDGIAYSFWATYSMLMGIGVFRPKKMLPLLLLQFVYKSIWLGFIFLPLWFANELAIAESDLFRSSAMGVAINLFVIPWKYVFKHYFKNDI